MRIRTVKPEFWQSEQLADVSRDARLVAIALLNYVDREGRCQDRVKRMHAVLFPYDPNLDLDCALNDLAGAGYLARYEVDGCRFIAVLNFSKHQRPNVHEPQSVIPPCEHDHNHAGVINSILPQEIKQSSNPEIHSLDPESREVYPASFLKFWLVYPRKDGKQTAVAAFKKLSADDQARAIADVPLRVSANWAGRENDKIPHATTYLNQRRWEDELMAANGRASPAGPRLSPGRQQLFEQIQRDKAKEAGNGTVGSETAPAQSIGHLDPPADGRRGAG